MSAVQSTYATSRLILETSADIQARNQGPRPRHARTGRGPSSATCRQPSAFTGMGT